MNKKTLIMITMCIILCTPMKLSAEKNINFEVKNNVKQEIITKDNLEETPTEIKTELISNDTYEKEVLSEEIKYAFIDYRDIYTEEEIIMLQKLTMAEAGNQSANCQMMVAETVLNRIDSELFPNTMKDVIYQKNEKFYQFSCIPDGNYSKAVPTQQVIDAVDAALFNHVNDISQNPDDMLYFNSIGYFSWAIDYCQDGKVYFSCQKN